MGLALPMGGHLTHGWNVSISGKYFTSVPYGVRKDTGRLDYDEIRDLAKKERPALLWAGGTAYSRLWDFETMAIDRARGGREVLRPTSRTSPGSSRAASTRRRSRTPTSSPPRRTRRCAARAAA